MTSGVFQSIPLSSIIINRDSRQRRVLEKVEELAASIRSIGLINPLVVTPDFELVAGERRLAAIQSLGWEEVAVQLTTDLPPIQLYLIELEENVKRVDLSWQDQNDAIEKYHRLQKELNPAWTQTDTGTALGLSESTISGHLLVADQRKSAPELGEAEKFSTARSISRRKLERSKDAVLRGLSVEPTESDLPPRFASIINQSFLQWAPQQDAPLYNFIHCDFPYGVNTGDKSGQSAAKSLGSYDDGLHVYLDLLKGMADYLDLFCAPEAHLMFWFSMNYYQLTIEELTKMGWDINPFPLIWLKSDNMGMLPDQNRGPRRIYETAFFGSRGDRKIVRPVSNAIALPTTKLFHTSEKPEAVLSHFFRMFVDESSRILDPTCGSGMAVKVGEEMGAAFSLGIEMDSDFAAAARINCSL